MWWCIKIDRYEVCCVLCQSILTGCNQRMEVCFQKIYNDTMRNESSKSYGGQPEPREIQKSSCLLQKKRFISMCPSWSLLYPSTVVVWQDTVIWQVWSRLTQFQCFIVISFALCEYFNIPALGWWWFSAKFMKIIF